MKDNIWDLEEMMREFSEEREKLEQLDESMPPDEILYDLAELFKVFGDSTRIKILYALFESELCVSELCELLEPGETAVAHQLRVLNISELVRFRKEGKHVYYSLADDHVRSIIGQGMEHIGE